MRYAVYVSLNGSRVGQVIGSPFTSEEAADNAAVAFENSLSGEFDVECCVEEVSA